MVNATITHCVTVVYNSLLFFFLLCSILHRQQQYRRRHIQNTYTHTDYTDCQRTELGNLVKMLTNLRNFFFAVTNRIKFVKDPM